MEVQTRRTFVVVCLLGTSLLLLPTPGNAINSGTDSAVTTVLYEWVEMAYDWEGMGEDEQSWINEGLYVPENCVLAGIKQWQESLFVTIPRWAPGVPATLNRVVERNGEALLEPFPSLSAQMLNNTQGLKNVQDIEIDPFGRMWIIDTGALNFYFPDQSEWHKPKLLVYDLTASGEPSLLREFTFPPDIAVPGETFINDIVVDVLNDFAYMTNSVGNGGLFAYDYQRNNARIWVDPSMAVEPDGIEFNVTGSGTYDIVTPSDGIALSPDIETLYYCPLSGFNLYSIPTELFRNFTTSDVELHDAVVSYGQRLSQSDGIALTANNTLYYGDIGHNAVLYWDPATEVLNGSNQLLLSEDEQTMQWVDTFGFDGKGGLIFVTNRLFLFPSSYDFSGNSGANFRIITTNVGELSYMDGTVEIYGL